MSTVQVVATTLVTIVSIGVFATFLFFLLKASRNERQRAYAEGMGETDEPTPAPPAPLTNLPSTPKTRLSRTFGWMGEQLEKVERKQWLTFVSGLIGYFAFNLVLGTLPIYAPVWAAWGWTWEFWIGWALLLLLIPAAGMGWMGISWTIIVLVLYHIALTPIFEPFLPHDMFKNLLGGSNYSTTIEETVTSASGSGVKNEVILDTSPKTHKVLFRPGVQINMLRPSGWHFAGPGTLTEWTHGCFAYWYDLDESDAQIYCTSTALTPDPKYWTLRGPMPEVSTTYVDHDSSYLSYMALTTGFAMQYQLEHN